MRGSLIIAIIVLLGVSADPLPAKDKIPTLGELRQAVAGNPQDPQAHYLLGLRYESQGQMTQARQQYQKAVRLKPDYGQALVSLGRLQTELGEHDGAIKNLMQALALKEGHVEARNLLTYEYNRQGLALMGAGRPQAAQEAFRKGTQISSNPAATAALGNNLGCAYLQEGRLQKATEVFREVLRKNPDVAQAHYNLAIIYYLQGDHHAAYWEFFTLKAIDRTMAKELADYRFIIRGTTGYAPPIRTLEFKPSPYLVIGRKLSAYAR